jgi:tetratricopeptide (TPR) repeat protein/V8-like Glu-specific endopeptidase
MSKYLYHFSVLLLTLWAVNTPAIAQSKTPTTASRQNSSPQQYTSIVKRIDDIAAQITVRIEDKQGHNGSGVIIAKEGNTYSVITAAHVVQDKQGESIVQSIITPSQQRIPLRVSQVTILNKDLDLALVKFTSTQNYRITEIANYRYQNKDWVFVSGFPGQDPNRRRKLSIGTIRDREHVDFEVKDKVSLSKGNNLVYTNLSLPGMSGGAVLDRQGRLMGINTGAENESILTTDRQEEINFGLALGIPSSTILGALERSKISLNRLKITTKSPSKLIDREAQDIGRTQKATLSIPSKASGAKEWLDYGNLLWRSGDNQSAVIAFDRAIEILKKDNISVDKDKLKLAYFGKGLAYFWEQNRDKEASTAFKSAIQVDPQFLQAWRHQGYVMTDLGRYSEALNCYQKVLEIDPNNFVALIERSDVLRQLKRYPDAIKSCNRAIQIQPNHPWAYQSRGGSYLFLKQYSQAMADFNKAISLNNQNAGAYNNRGVAFQSLKQYLQSLANFDRAIALDSQLVDAYYNRGTVYYSLNKSDRALADFDRAIALDPKYLYAHLNRGNVRYQLKQYSLAIADFNREISLNSKSAEAYDNRGIVYRELKQYPQAIADHSKAIALNPQIAGAYGNRGGVYLQMRQYPQALANFNKAIAIDPQLASAYSNRGLVYHELQQYSQAITNFNRAIALDPQFANAYLVRGFSNLKLQQPDRAKSDWEMAARLYQEQGDRSKYELVIGFLQQLAQVSK